jgi:hypothetical protein
MLLKFAVLPDISFAEAELLANLLKVEFIYESRKNKEYVPHVFFHKGTFYIRMCIANDYDPVVHGSIDKLLQWLTNCIGSSPTFEITSCYYAGELIKPIIEKGA